MEWNMMEYNIMTVMDFGYHHTIVFFSMLQISKTENDCVASFACVNVLLSAASNPVLLPYQNRTGYQEYIHIVINVYIFE